MYLSVWYARYRRPTGGWFENVQVAPSSTFLSSTTILFLRTIRTRRRERETKHETRRLNMQQLATRAPRAWFSISKRRFTAPHHLVASTTRRINVFHAFQRPSFPVFNFFVRPTPSFLSISRARDNQSLSVSARESNTSRRRGIFR